MRWSIRRQLTLLNTIVLAVLLVGFAGLIYWLLARAVIGSVDGRLTECRRQLEREPRTATDSTKLHYWIEEFWEHEQVVAAVFAADGRILMRTEALAADAVPAPPAAAPEEPRFLSAKVPVLGRQRVMTARLPHSDDGRNVVLMANLADADRTLAQLRAVLFSAVPVMLLVAAMAAYGLAARALAPMKTLQREARAITAESLDRRLPVANPDDELGRLTATINDMVQRLQRSFAEMKRFTADASHELRSPLSAIRMEAEVSLGRDLSQDEMQELLGNVLEECERLTRLTDQLLTLARHDAESATQHETVNLTSLIGSVVETMRPFAESKGLTLTFQPATLPGEASVTGDPVRLRQVFVNLLDNALKYTDVGSVSVTIEAAEREWIVRLTDTGEGIPADHLPHVFERFYRVDKARSREMGGSGLGLSIAKSIVESQEGRIELESAPGRGTTCVVSFPRPAG